MRTALSVVLTVSLVSGGLLTFGSAPGEGLGLDTVTIYRDSFGVPHIYGNDEYAVWYANGYAQAMDRLWAMDLVRHVSYGEGSSVAGPGGGVLALDLAARRDLYTREQLEAMWAAAPADLVFAVRAYTAGVNRAAAEMHAKGDMPAEFPALQHAFEPWTELDTAAVASFLLARFGEGGGAEVANLRLANHLRATLGPADGETAFGDVVRGDPTGVSHSTIPAASGSYPNAAAFPAPKPFAALPPEQAALLGMEGTLESFGLATTPALPFPGPGSGTHAEAVRDLAGMKWGSNALLVAASHSASGRALVGGGPQTGYFNPQILYEVGLHDGGGDLDVAGVGVLGAPGVVLGRTARFAWTVTSGASDQTDTIALAAAGPRSYWWDGAEVALDCRNEVHRLLAPPAVGGPSFDVVTQEVCRAPFGSVTAVARDGEGEITHFFVERRSSYLREAQSAAQWLRQGKAWNLEAFRQNLEGFAFTFNFHFAGLDGASQERACYMHVGALPLRNLALDPRFPTPGDPAFMWTGELTGAALPNDCDPAQGYYANWNNYPQQGWSAGDSRELWGSLHRVEHLDAMVAEAFAADGDGKLTLDQVKAILKEAATRDTLAAQVAPAVLPLMPGGDAKDALDAWAAAGYPWRAGGAVSNPLGTHYDDAGHTVYDHLLTGLHAAVLGDEQGALRRVPNLDPRTAGDPHAADHGEHNNMYAVMVDALTGASAYPWCDDRATPAAESCGDVVAAWLADAPFAGSDTIPLTEQHVTRFSSLGAGPAYTMPMTNRATYYHFHEGSDPTTSGSAIAPGQSGHLNGAQLLLLEAGFAAPPHMRNQLPLYIGFHLKPVPFDQSTIVANPTTLLVPRD